MRSARRRHQSLQSSWFWAILIALFRHRFLDFRSRWIVLNHVIRGCPGRLLQLSSWGEAVKIASALYGIRALCTNRAWCCVLQTGRLDRKKMIRPIFLTFSLQCYYFILTPIWKQTKLFAEHTIQADIQLCVTEYVCVHCRSYKARVQAWRRNAKFEPRRADEGGAIQTVGDGHNVAAGNAEHQHHEWQRRGAGNSQAEHAPRRGYTYSLRHWVANLSDK